MNRERLETWMEGNFHEGRTIYRGNNKEYNILSKNIGKEVEVLMMPSRKIAVVVPTGYLGYDSRKEWEIPEDEKGWSLKNRRNVPNRHTFSIEPFKWERK